MTEKIVIPLYYRPADPGARTPAGVSLEALEGDILITADTYGGLLAAGLDEVDLPRFIVFDLPSEAVAADFAMGLMSASIVPKGREVDVLRDGEGVLMLPDREFRSRIQIDDARTGIRTAAIVGSWELPAEECERLMSAAPTASQGRPGAVARKIADAGNLELLRAVQVRLEREPGALVSFVSLSPDEVRKDARCAGIDPVRLPDSELQVSLWDSSREFGLDAVVLSDALEATVERIEARNPDLFLDRDALAP
ncbi:hypothetical protein LAZ40_06805 [Cereibacter sphaeroides]|uniref:hypothetical protein n=1 Tax=Cereibacter sphaeroides TaxID=1063 RepID=UPI001F236A59|nr:hypothetical protein [Cereibacter sphaeroides]MCE6958756.1 hypothetical protein [Cereibacter sphaeroides]MCE6973370.1 hypothetical protein [Cereibacter sphaeroides]